MLRLVNEANVLLCTHADNQTASPRVGDIVCALEGILDSMQGGSQHSILL